MTRPTDMRFTHQIAFYALRSKPADRWLPFLTHEVPAADVRPGFVLADEHGDLIRVTAVGHGPGLVLLYVGPDDDAPHQVPNRRLRLRPTDVVRVPREVH